MAPEQARGESVDQRADVFALGATLFHVLAGKPPFGGMSAAERIARASEGEQVPLDQLPEEIPRDLVAIVGKAMAGDRTDRYRDAGELASDMRAFLAGQLVAARQYTAAQRAARFLRKHAIAAIAITAVAIAALVFGIVTIGGIVDARSEADDQRVKAENSARLERAQKIETRLQHAASVAVVDPTRSALMVQPYLRDEHYGPRARDLVTAVAAMGIARGSSVRGGLTRAGTMSPDGRRLVTSSNLSGVHLFDLETGEGIQLAKGHRVITDLLWPERETVVGIDDVGLIAFDAASGVSRRLASGTLNGAWYVEDRRAIRFVDHNTQELREVALTGGTPTVIARRVDVANGAGDTTVIVGGGELRLMTAGCELVLDRTSEVSHWRQIAVSPNGDVAAGYRAKVRAWRGDGTELYTWDVETPIELRYSGRELMVAGAAGVWTLANRRDRVAILVESSQAKDGYGSRSLATLTETPSGPAYGFSDGRVNVGDYFGFRRIPYPSGGVVRLVGSPNGPYIAALFNNGDVRWWKVADVLMRVYSSPAEQLATASLCWATRTTIVLKGGAAINVIDRTTLKSRMREHAMFVAPAQCHGVINNAMYLTGADGKLARVDLGTLEVELVSLPRSYIIDEVVGSIYYSRDHALVELVGGRGPEVVKWTAPAPIASFFGGRGWFVIASAGGLHLLERATGTVREIARADDVDWLGVDAAGTAYWVKGRLLAIQRVNVPAPSFRELSARIVDGFPQREDGFLVELKDGSLWLSSDTGAIGQDFDVHSAIASDDRGRASSREAYNLAVHHIRSGVTYRRRLVNVASQAFDPDGQLFVMGGATLGVWRAPALAAPSVEAWLETATNATLTNNVLSWPTPRRQP